MRLLWRNVSDSASLLCAKDGRYQQPVGPDSADSTPKDLAALVDEMIRCHRSALLLRPKLAHDLDPSVLRAAVDRLRQDVCYVSAGCVRLNRWQVDVEVNSDGGDSTDRVDVGGVYLERCTITNAQYQAFVDQGGYEKKSFWHASVWPRVREFVDLTGSLGPRFWSGGRHNGRLADHPVVGVSWFEAEAYSRWIGMRLPTDAEWVRAACSPIEADGTIVQRKYPWGDLFLPDRANLLHSGTGRTVPVHSHAEGDTVCGARQMIGNVWEWTASNLQLWNRREPLELAELTKSLRGGAFDSYLDTRATCQCRSADTPLARRHNIGIRCAIGVSDVVNLRGQVDDGAATRRPSEGMQ